MYNIIFKYKKIYQEKLIKCFKPVKKEETNKNLMANLDKAKLPRAANVVS